MTTDSPSLYLDDTAVEHLRSARKWSNFLSIIGFVLIGIMILIMAAFLLFGSLVSSKDNLVSFTSFVQIVPIALMIVIYGIPIYYLYQFGKHSSIAINNYDSDAIGLAFKYLNLHYRFMGILVIVVLAFYLVAIVVMTMGFPFFSTMMNR